MLPPTKVQLKVVPGRVLDKEIEARPPEQMVCVAGDIITFGDGLTVT
jgi:hypothetical protein